MIIGKNSDIEVTRQEPIKSFLDVLKNLGSLFKYFTIWILLLDILYLTGVIKGIEFFLIFIHIFIIIFCLYIFYYKYEKFRTKTFSMDITFRGTTLKLIDFIFHYVPLILIIKYILCRKTCVIVNKTNLFLTALVPLIYFIFDTSCQIYFLTTSKCSLYFVSYWLVAMIITLIFSLYTPFCQLKI